METYKLNILCENCKYRWVAELKKGWTISSYAGVDLQCPYCGCTEYLVSEGKPYVTEGTITRVDTFPYIGGGSFVQ